MKTHDTEQRKKSLKERFFLIIGLVFFALYLGLGLVFIFWKTLPIQMEYKYRIAFGVVLIVYAFLRFVRFFKNNNVQDE